MERDLCGMIYGQWKYRTKIQRPQSQTHSYWSTDKMRVTTVKDIQKKELSKKKPLCWFENVLFCLDWIGCVRSVAVLAGNNERDVFSVGDVNYHHPLHQPTHFFIIPNNTLCHPWWFWRYICQPSYEQKTFSSVILSKRFWSQWNNTSSCIPLHKFVNGVL